jgi:hypothetical protein
MELENELKKEATRVGKLNPLDLQHEIKRANSIIKTPEGREALRQVLGLPLEFTAYSDAPDKEPEVKKPRVAILMPTADQPKKETIDSARKLMALSQQRVDLFFPPNVSSSIVHWVRNRSMVHLETRYKWEYDYVLWWDDDMVVTSDALLRLLAHKVDLVAGGCTVRHDPPIPNFRIWSKELDGYQTAFEWSAEGLIEMAGVGAAFMLCSKKVMDEVAEYYLTCEHEQRYMGMSKEFAGEMEKRRREAAERTGNKWWFRNLLHPSGADEFGEDISFCFAAEKRGIKTHVDTTVRPRHMGDYGYGLDDYLPFQKEMLEQQRTEGKSAAEAIGEDLAELVGVES